MPLYMLLGTALIFVCWVFTCNVSFLLDASMHSSLLAANKFLGCLNRSIFWNHKIKVKLTVSRPMLNSVEKHFKAWVMQTLLLRISLR